MRGKNPIRKPILDDGSKLDVKNIFATLQGEGLYVGTPAVFVRLGGCNLACEFCDTDFESFVSIPLADIMDKVKKLAGDAIKLIVITGGEPLRQNIVPFCEELLVGGYSVQIETNGTLYRELPQEADIVCSPKSSIPLREDLLQKLSALKFLISANNNNYNDVPEVGQSKYNIPVFVQPMDEYDEAKNIANRNLAMELAMRHGYRLSLQIHKILNIE